MIDSLYFDSDSISAFLWVKEQSLLALLYPGMIVIPKPAYEELSYPTTPHLKQRIDVFVPQVQLFNADGEEETVDIYTKFNVIDMSNGSRTVVISFHKLNKPIDYLFR